jgi:hypothetical protein
VVRDLTGVWPNAYKEEPPVEPTQETLNKVRWLTIRFIKSKRGKEWAKGASA